MTTRCKQHVILFVTPWSGFSNLTYLSCELEGEVSFCKPLCLGQMQVGRREHWVCVLERITHLCAGALFPGGLRPLNYSSPWWLSRATRWWQGPAVDPCDVHLERSAETGAWLSARRRERVFGVCAGGRADSGLFSLQPQAWCKTYMNKSTCSKRGHAHNFKSSF